LNYFEDIGPAGQITGSGQIQSPKQISRIGSIDLNYDLSKKLTIGAKYGYRGGKVSLGRNSDVFVSSDAHLAVLRADYHVNKQWDLMAEGRALWVTAADDKRFGALGAIYRHLGNNVKVGVGYSLSDFSDDLTDQSYTSHGPFFNILGKF
jgi:predicted porin